MTPRPTAAELTEYEVTALIEQALEARRNGDLEAYGRLRSLWLQGVEALKNSGPGGGGGRAGNGAGETLVCADAYREPPSPAPGSIHAYFKGAKARDKGTSIAGRTIGIDPHAPNRAWPPVKKTAIRPAPRSLIGRGVGAVLEIAWLGYQLVRR